MPKKHFLEKVKKDKLKSHEAISRQYDRQGHFKETSAGIGLSLKDALGHGMEYVDENPDTSFTIIPSNKKGEKYNGKLLTHKFTKKAGRWYEKNAYRYDRNRERQGGGNIIFSARKALKGVS